MTLSKPRLTSKPGFESRFNTRDSTADRLLYLTVQSSPTSWHYLNPQSKNHISSRLQIPPSTHMHRLLRSLQSKSPKRDGEKTKHKSRTAQNDNSPLSNLPYEVIENILAYAWHGDPTGLPGGGSYIFDDPRALFNDIAAATAERLSDGEDETTTTTSLVPDPDLPTLPALQPAPHTRLTNAAWAARNGTGVFLGTETYLSLALVCVMWREIMLDITKTYVSLPSLKKFHEYARVLEIDVPRDDVLSRLKDSQQHEKVKAGASEGNGGIVEGAVPLSKSAEKARRLCRSLHIDIPTGNLTMVPSWHDIPTVIAPLTSLTYLILTAAEPHPALLSLLTTLPPTLTMLDIHISSPFAYKPLVLGGAGAPMSTAATIAQTQAEMARRETGRRNMESLRSGVSNIKHVLINVIDPVLLGSLLEGFGSMETSTSTANNRSSTTVYASRALQAVTLQGMHDLTCPEITRTISHSSTIHTLRLYPHANRLPNPKLVDGLQGWNAVRALENEAWFPALERLIVQLPGGYLGQSPQLERIREACSKRGVLVDVERLP